MSNEYEIRIKKLFATPSLPEAFPYTEGAMVYDNILANPEVSWELKAKMLHDHCDTYYRMLRNGDANEHRLAMKLAILTLSTELERRENGFLMPNPPEAQP
jgi:hypothetical protein